MIQTMPSHDAAGSRVETGNVSGRDKTHVQRLIRPLAVALVITFLIFGLYEMVERIWLRNVDLQLLQLLHTARGVFCSLLVAAVAAWTILKSSPPLLAAPFVRAEQMRQSSLSGLELKKICAKSFIAMRWVAVLFAGLLVYFSVWVVRWLPQEVWWPLVLALATLAGANALYSVLFRWTRGASAVLIVQGYVDLAILTTLLHFSGGVENPLSMMMVFHVIIGGILLSRGHGYGLAATGSLLFALMAWAEGIDLIGHYTLQLYPHPLHQGELFHPAHESLYVTSSCIIQAAVLFLMAYFVTTLAERMRSNERWLALMADQALADRQLLERALETTDTGLQVLDRNLKPDWVSNRWTEWFVCSPGTPCPGCELLNGKNSLARQSLQDGRTRMTELALTPVNCGLKLFKSSSDPRVFQITTAPLLDSVGEVSQIVQLAQDNTQQKQTQARMLRASQLAVAGELAGKVAHEVNNPIAILGAKARLLLSDHGEEMSPKVAQELRKITELADRVARIARGLLSYCRPSTSARVELDIRIPIRKSLAMIEQNARSRNIEIGDHLPASIPLVKGSGNELEQVFLNLFLNAFDAMPNGGRLTVSAHAGAMQSLDSSEGVAIVVEDTGGGIAETIRERIFEPFFTTKQAERGTGLGLSICLGLIRSHGGEIEVESEPGKGTRFTVKLPVAAPAQKPEALHV